MTLLTKAAVAEVRFAAVTGPLLMEGWKVRTTSWSRARGRKKIRHAPTRNIQTASSRGRRGPLREEVFDSPAPAKEGVSRVALQKGQHHKGLGESLATVHRPSVTLRTIEVMKKAMKKEGRTMKKGKEMKKMKTTEEQDAIELRLAIVAI